MSTTFTWKVTKLNFEKADGFVTSAEYRVTSDDSASRAGAYISVEFERPDVLIPLDDLTEEIVAGWIQDMFGDHSS